jgi:SAM-dependent methyltransferase
MRAAGILEERRQKWKSKEVLRRLYYKWYSLIAEWIRPGVVLELGGGSGNLKEYFPDAVSSDIVFAPWLDAVFDAQRLPLRNESVSSIVLFDVLHHLSAPALFFSEAERALRIGGRIIMMEPYVSCASFLVYKYLHQEGLNRDGNPLSRLLEERDPFQGNQAIPAAIFGLYRQEFSTRYPRLEIVKEEKMDFFNYPLSGGFHHRPFCPSALYPVLEKLERFLAPLNSCLAFRMFIVLEKRH